MNIFMLIFVMLQNGGYISYVFLSDKMMFSGHFGPWKKIDDFFLQACMLKLVCKTALHSFAFDGMVLQTCT